MPVQFNQNNYGTLWGQLNNDPNAARSSLGNEIYSQLFDSSGPFSNVGTNLDPNLREQLINSGLQQADQMQQARLNYIKQGFGNLEGGAYNSSIGVIKNISQVLQQADKAGLDSTQLPLLQKAISGDATAMQGLGELVNEKAQQATQTQQFQNFTNQTENQMFGGKGLSLGQAVSNPQGDLGSLNQALTQQEGNVFQTQLRPLVQDQLGGQGLIDSGANVELQSRALAGLESQRQQSLLQAALNDRSTLQGLNEQNVVGNIGYAQQSLANEADIQRAGITMQFQQQLENQREQLARQLFSRNGNGNGALGTFQGILGGGMSGAMAGMAGGPYGALVGGALGAGLGGYAGSQNPMLGSFMGSTPSMIGATSGFFRNNSMPAPTQTYNPYSGPMNNSGYSWPMTGGGY